MALTYNCYFFGVLTTQPNLSGHFKRSKYLSANRFGFLVGNLCSHFGPFALVNGYKWSFAQFHRFKTQNVVLSVMIEE